MSQVTIIGSGTAGVAAALAAKQGGAEVTVIAGRPGATALVSGAWDIALSQRSRWITDWQAHPSPREEIVQLIAENSLHPYARLRSLAGDTDLATLLEEVLQQLATGLSHPPIGSLEKGQVLITPLGSVKWTAFADPAQGAGNLLPIRGGKLLVVGIPGLATFPISLLTSVLGQVLPAGVFDQIQNAWVEIEGLPQHSLSPFALAERLEEEATLVALIKELQPLVQREAPTHLLLPPVIGIDQAPERIARLSRELKVSCFESLATVPSVPGLRRHRALTQLLANSGVIIKSGKVVDPRCEGGRVCELVIEENGKQETLPVERVVLTTGRFLAGGIKRDGEMVESLFGLPVFCRGEVVGDRFVGKMTERDYLADQPLFSMGVETDVVLRPVNRWGEVEFKNLHAAGSLLGGYNAAAGGDGSGVALLSGWLAGKKAAE